MGKYFYNITQIMKFQRCNLNGRERMPPLKQLSSRSGGFKCQPCKVQYLQKNSHAFNYNKFSSQVKLCHLENINIIYNLFASLFHRKFLLLANFPLFSGKKKNYFYGLSQDGFLEQVNPSKMTAGTFWTHLLPSYLL